MRNRTTQRFHISKQINRQIKCAASKTQNKIHNLYAERHLGQQIELQKQQKTIITRYNIFHRRQNKIIKYLRHPRV